MILVMNNLKGNLDIHLEEDHLGAPLPSSQVSACSAASHLSYHDSPRSQPLALAPEVEEEMSAWQDFGQNRATMAGSWHGRYFFINIYG